MTTDMEITEQDWEQAEGLASRIDDRGPAQVYRALAAFCRDQRVKHADDALLAGILRRILDPYAEGHVGYGPHEGFRPPAWLTIDVRRVTLTDEEFAAIERAGQP